MHMHENICLCIYRETFVLEYIKNILNTKCNKKNYS